ncbi:MAG: hypothetical protein O7G13_04660 [Alphaproteobacteria bacterium]|nr:hypothetical protein [Alphaproteobacteria bacterium]MCZ6509057.1 hypothetical protein [Alphaproteobacteria bacterium]MCZ6589503.1 hypothetical protein [Alphaproteobacteria bacterium]MCZ6838548.1 hypothetical protein [Alphaproteobacteria bacterium]MCZ6846432.1 hypothetical protein [Alphaproteobacteria bacterium]
MDENIVRLDARLGALELLVRNLYAHRFAGQSDPLGAAEQAVRDIERLAKRIEVAGPEPVVNDLLAAEAEEFLIAMFREIVEIVREIDIPAQSLEIHTAWQPVLNRETPEWPPFQRPSPKLRRTG